VIIPDKVFEIIEKADINKVVIIFEFFYAAHAIPDESAVDNLKRSVEYWREALQRIYG
jgi:hypothetical protein